MKLSIRLLTTALFTMTTPVLAYADLPKTGIVRLASEYIDEGTGQRSRVSGAGTVFAVADVPSGRQKLFIITASHVSFGNPSRLYINDQVVATANFRRATDIAADLDLLELSSASSAGLTPIGTWSQSARRIIADPAKLKLVVGANAIRTSDAPPFSSELPSTFIAIPGWTDQTGARSALPQAFDNQARSVNQSTITFNGFRFGDSGVSLLPLTNEKFSLMQVVPGMSGEALWETVTCPPDALQFAFKIRSIRGRSFCYEISGVVTRYLRDLTGSYFASDTQIASLIENELNTPPSTSEKSSPVGDRWHMRGCNLYRSYRDGAAETSLLTAPGGGHSSADGGDVCRGVDPNFSMHEIAGGIRWVDRQHPKGAVAYALDYEGIGPIATDSNTPLLKRTMKLAGPGLPDPVVLGSELNFAQAFVKKFKHSMLGGSYTGDWDDLHLQSFAMPQQVEAHGRAIAHITSRLIEIQVQFKGSSSDRPENIQILLNSHGSLVDSKGAVVQSYTGNVNVHGDRGSLFRLDIRSLFFLQALNLQRADDVLDLRSAPYLLVPTLEELKQMQDEGPVLKVSLAGTGTWSIYSFAIEVR